MDLGSTTHFAQGWDLALLQSAAAVQVRKLRDEITWSTVETAPGVYDFSAPTVSYVGNLLGQGFQPTILFQGGNPNYDGGATPYTDAGRAAFADFIVATLTRFPGIKSIEIGNEFNSNDFVSGPVQTSDYALRDDYYTALLKAVYDKVKAVRPDVQVLGGAAHSIPVGYYEALIADGALHYMDGVVIHPYTSEPEEFAKQLDVLKAAMGANPLPIYATEYSRSYADAGQSADYLIKMTTVMAAAGVAGADWYGLRQEGNPPGSWYPNTALLTVGGAVTTTGQAFAFEDSALLSRGTPQRIAIDDFTFAYRYGSDALVIWGAPRDVNFTGTVKYYNAEGQQIAKPAQLSPDEPLIVIGAGPITYGGNFTLGATSLIADSFTQFDYTADPSGAQTFEGPWSYFAYSVVAQAMAPLYTQGGGEIAASNWTPYIGSDWLRPLSVSAQTVTPVDFGSAASPNVFKIVERYTAASAATVAIKSSWDVIDTSVDGIDLTIKHNGQVIYTGVVKTTAEVDLSHIALLKGDTLDFITGTNGTPAGGDATDRHIQIFSETPAPTPTPTPTPTPMANNIVHGTAGDDVMIGLPVTNALYGEGGNDVIIGQAQADRLDGGAGNDVLLGSDGNDLLVGGAGMDALNGGSGADRMEGGDGDDTYTVDNPGDVVVEAGGGGHDQVITAIDYTLPAEVEDLLADGPAGLRLTGNTLDNRLIGGSGADVLTGGAGKDILIGGGGADTFRFVTSEAKDLALDFNRAEGDRIDVSALLKGVAAAALSASPETYVKIAIDLAGTEIQVRSDPAAAFQQVAMLTGVTLTGTVHQLVDAGVLLIA